MSNSNEFAIDESTLKKLIKLKDEAGFREKTWDEWFNFIFNFKSSTTQTTIEKVMEKLHYESFDEWVQNFAINLNQIWEEPSARTLDPLQGSKASNEEHSAIVIGRGPSLKKHNHLELIAKSNYKGSIICGDGVLISALQAGITPDKFPKFYVITIDPLERQKKFYDNDLVNKHGEKINGIFTTIAHPFAVSRARQAGIKIHWVHPLFDYEKGKKSFNQISALMVRAKNHRDGLPAIQTGGNVGTSAWFVGWKILRCNIIALVGINHGWEEDDSWETIISHGRTLDPKFYGGNVSINVDKNDPSFEKLFRRIYNPEFNCYSIVDPLFQFYSNAFKEFINRSPEWLTTINATEGGSIFGERIRSMKLSDFLEKHHS
jgi:hypothetical protein